MTLLEIIKRQMAAEAAFLGSEGQHVANRASLKGIAERWSSAMVARAQSDQFIREAEYLERASGIPAEGAGSPDGADHDG